MRPYRLAGRFVGASIVVALAGCCTGTESEPPVELIPPGDADLAIPDEISELPLSFVVDGPRWAFHSHVTYEIAQYYEKNTNPPVPGRLVDYPAGLGGPSPVYANLGNYDRKVVGFVFIARQTDGSDVQRWLLLHETKMASVCDMEIKPATEMPGASPASPAPTTVADFAARALTIYDARKTAAGANRAAERTRYVKVRSRTHELNDSLSDAPPDTGVPAPPASPLPSGNGVWIGGAAFQLDGGSVGIWIKGSGEFVGYMQENNAGHSGTEQWELDDTYAPPSVISPILVGKTAHMGVTGDSVDDLGEIVSGGSQLEWNVVRESATYYGDTFPTTDP